MEKSSQQAEKRFLDIARSFDTAMLITRTSGGGLHARPMSVAEVANDGDLWFVTGFESTKVHELDKDDRVLVAMAGSTKHLSVSGRAQVVRDQAKVQQLWSEKWRVWFKGKDDPDLALIHVRATEAEYWDNSWVQGVKFAFRAAKAYITGAEMNQGDDVQAHAKVPL